MLTPQQQYEILPNLFAFLSNDVVIENDTGIDDYIIHASQIGLGNGFLLIGADTELSDDIPNSEHDGSFIIGRDVTIKATIERNAALHFKNDDVDGDRTTNSSIITIKDLDITIEGGCEFNTDYYSNNQILAFLREFAVLELTSQQQQQQSSLLDDYPSSSPCRILDIVVNNATVREFSFQLPDNPNNINFPLCQGTEACTLRTILSYYFTSILKIIDPNDSLLSFTDEQHCNHQSTTAVVADMTSVEGSLIGATAGALLLGPLGFLAGSYLGGQLGRTHSTAMVGATAGACLFGPVGIIAGVAGASYARSSTVGESSSSSSSSGITTSTSSTAFGGSSRQIQDNNDKNSNPNCSMRQSVVDHISNNKYEYAGTTGVVAGATAGAVAGPVGMLAGAYIGSVTARRGTEIATNAATEASEIEGRSKGGYRFGDVTRGLVARGKQSRGVTQEEQYRFGDFTRGLFANRRK